MSNAVLYTDGSSSSKSGMMGWAVVGEINGFSVGCCGWDKGTNQLAELRAVLQALVVLTLRAKPFSKACIVSDSAYALGCCQDFRATWEANGYLNYQGQEIKNKQTILKIHDTLDLLRAAGVQLELQHCRGHVGIEGNEYADALCGVARLVGEGRATMESLEGYQVIGSI